MVTSSFQPWFSGLKIFRPVPVYTFRGLVGPIGVYTGNAGNRRTNMWLGILLVCFYFSAVSWMPIRGCMQKSWMDKGRRLSSWIYKVIFYNWVLHTPDRHSRKDESKWAFVLVLPTLVKSYAGLPFHRPRFYRMKLYGF